jgi:hypothetical protein
VAESSAGEEEDVMDSVSSAAEFSVLNSLILDPEPGASAAATASVCS